MADIKFSCAHCGQHISCDEPWSGHQIQCPACQKVLVVPHLHPPPVPAVAAPKSLTPQPPAPIQPKLSAGPTQATRPTPPVSTPHRQIAPRPPQGGNPILKFAVIAVVLLTLGWAGFNYLPGLLTQLQETGTSKTPAPGNSGTGTGGGPLGEVNGAMDVSDALDGSAPPRPRPAAARPAVATRPPGAPATNSAANPARRRPR